LRSAVVAGVTTAALVLAAPPTARAQSAATETRTAATAPAGPQTGASGAASPQAEAAGTIWLKPRDPLDMARRALALKPWDVYPGSRTSIPVPNASALHPLLSDNAKTVIIVCAIVGGVILIVAIAYGVSGPHGCVRPGC